MAKVAKKTNMKLWKRIVSSVKAGSKGGRPGQWSARKAQIATKRYKAAGGGYSGKKSSKNKLRKWGKQKWRTKSGKKSSETGERYLPEKAIKSLSSSEYAATTRAKREGSRKGKQYVKQPKSIARKVKKYRT
tara:strand:- start:748 stop:1143 length:396 start_codon:yes stop_codon:yes gene_type:complete